jgi:hypothetical protein
MQVLRLRRSHKANGFAQDDTFLGFTDYATANANAMQRQMQWQMRGFFAALRMTTSGEKRSE